jgi:hypothetical protein
VPGFEPRPAGSHTKHLANGNWDKKARDSVDRVATELEESSTSHGGTAQDSAADATGEGGSAPNRNKQIRPP